MNSRKIGIGAAAGAAAAMCAASVAWACTYQPRIFGLSAESGAPQTAVTVTGNTAGARGPVQIRWNGAGGAVLGQAAPDASGNFSIGVTIPDAAPDVYSLMAVSDGVGVARSAFEVTAPASAGATAGDSTSAPAQADAWNTGFTASHPGSSRGASVVDASEQGGPSPALLLGVSLAAAGLTALGAAAVSVRRRRVTATL